MLLPESAHARAGDKGNISNISVIAYDPKDYPWREQHVTAERVKAHLADIVEGEVQGFALPSLGALNFVLHNALDAHGKTLSSAILSLDLPEQDGPVRGATPSSRKD